MKQKIYHIIDIGCGGHSALLCGLWNRSDNSIDIDILRYEPEQTKDLRLCKKCLRKFREKELDNV